MKCWRMSAAAPTDNTCVVGDVRGIMPFTHAAKYQGRIAADAVFGRPRTATYDGIPRVVFARPRHRGRRVDRPPRRQSRGWDQGAAALMEGVA